MFFARRHRPLLIWLAVLGVLAQSWMPMAHALAMVQAAGAGAAAYCGPKNSALAQKLRAVAPQELRIALEQSGELANPHDDCPPCAGCGGAFVPPVLAATFWPSSPHSALARSSSPECFSSDSAAPPPARGPPSPS